MKKFQLSLLIKGQYTAYYKIGSGPPLLFLHGGRVEARTFKKLLLDLSKQYTVFAPDVPGYGTSETPKDIWSFIEYAHFFNDFLRHLKLTEVVVVGYSMGGGIAFNLAAISSDISHLVLVNASGIKFKRKSRSSYDMRRLLFYITHPQYFLTFITLVRDFMRFSWKHGKSWRHISCIRSRCLNTSYDEVFKKILIPTTIVWGADDWIYPLKVSWMFKKRIPHARLVLTPGNHDWLLYDPLRFRGTML